MREFDKFKNDIVEHLSAISELVLANHNELTNDELDEMSEVVEQTIGEASRLIGEA